MKSNLGCRVIPVYCRIQKSPLKSTYPVCSNSNYSQQLSQNLTFGKIFPTNYCTNILFTHRKLVHKQILGGMVFKSNLFSGQNGDFILHKKVFQSSFYPLMESVIAFRVHEQKCYVYKTKLQRSGSECYTAFIRPHNCIFGICATFSC